MANGAVANTQQIDDDWSGAPPAAAPVTQDAATSQDDWSGAPPQAPPQPPQASPAPAPAPAPAPVTQDTTAPPAPETSAPSETPTPPETPAPQAPHQIRAAAGYYMAPRGVNADLHAAVAAAFRQILPPGYTAKVTSGARFNDPSSQHYGAGRTATAEDWHIYDQNGNSIGAFGRDYTGLYRAAAIQAQRNLFTINPAIANRFAWGGYFETHKGSGVSDIEHFDLGGPRGGMFGDPSSIYRQASQLSAQVRAMRQAQQPQTAGNDWSGPPPTAAPPAPANDDWSGPPPAAQIPGQVQPPTQQAPIGPEPASQDAASAAALEARPPGGTTPQPVTQPPGPTPGVQTPESAAAMEQQPAGPSAASAAPAAGGFSEVAWPTEVADPLLALGARGAGSLISGTGRLINPQNIVQGTAGAIGEHLEQHAVDRQQEAIRQLQLFDRIDKGEKFPQATLRGGPVTQTADGTPVDYQHYQLMSPEDRQALRQQMTELAQTPAEQTTGYKVGQATLETVPEMNLPIPGAEYLTKTGNWLNRAGEEIRPPEGWEDSIPAYIGENLGNMPPIIAGFWLGGPLGAASVVGAQTFNQEYETQLKRGIGYEDATTNAGLKALGNSAMMTLPVWRWAETLQGMAKRAFVAAASRMAADGVIMGSVAEAQKLVNNIIDRATTQPEKPLTEGIGEPKQVVAEVAAGMVPGAIGAAHAVSGRPTGETLGTREGAPGTPSDVIEPLRQRPGQAGAEPGPPGTAESSIQGEPGTAPATKEERVQPGITTPPVRIVRDPLEETGERTESDPLIRATDSAGNDWIGHGGVLVVEGKNPEVDAHFREAEQGHPVEATQVHENAKPLDDLMTDMHVNARQGILWSGTETEPDGRTVVVGQDAEGRNVRLDEDRYAVLSKYGDPARDAYAVSEPGRPSIVAMRDPSTGQVVAIAQSVPPLQERELTPGQHTTLEEQDALASQAGNRPTVPPMEVRGAPVRSDPNYVYHATNEENLQGIRDSGQLDTHEPSFGTDQETWPDGSSENRAYFTPTAENTAQFAPAEGKPVLLRVAKDAVEIKSERGTPDLYSTEPVPAEHVEYLGTDGNWHSVLEGSAAAKPGKTQRQPGLTFPDITDRPSLYRQAFRDAGHDPDVAVNMPVTRQIQILSQHLENTFGFKVTVHPKMQPQKAIDSMLDAYRNLQWMAHALGYPLRAMSLNGKIELRIEPFRPTKTYLGMFEWSGKQGGTIYMPDRSNSYAHEWTHALDHELVSRLAQNPTARGRLLTSKTRAGALMGTIRPGNAEEAFANVMRAIFHDRAAEAQRIAQLNALAQDKTVNASTRRAAAAEAQRIVAGAKAQVRVEPTMFVKGAMTSVNPRYYAMPEELLARAGEAYVAHVVANSGGGNEFITKGDQAYLDQADQRFQELYPQGSDRDAIFQAFQDLHAQLIRDGVLGRGGARRPGDYDILDPIHWRVTGNPQANPQVTNALRRAVTKATSWRQRYLEQIGQRAGAQGPLQLRRPRISDFFRVKDAVTPHIHTNMGQIDVYRERYEGQGNHAAAQTLSNILDKLGWRYGENRLQATPFENRARAITNQAVNAVDNIMRRHGLRTDIIDLDTEHQLFDALRGRDTRQGGGAIDPAIQRAAGEIRGVLNDFWYKIEQSGIAVGYPRDEGYLPIVYDNDAIRNGGQQSLDTLTRAYQTEFDVQQGKDSTFIHDAVKDLPSNTLGNLRPLVNDLAKIQEAMRTETDPAKLAALDAQHQALLQQLHDPVRDLWSETRAKQWVFNIDNVPWLDRRNATLPGANALKKRTFSAEARDILANEGLIITRPSELLPFYFHQMGRKLASAQLFGAKDEVLHNTMEQLRLAGVLHQDRIEIEKSMEAALGRMQVGDPTLGGRGSVWARSLATMALMGRSAWSTVGEPMAIAAVTGQHRIAFKAFADSMHQLMMELNVLKGNDRAQHLRDIANVLGVTTTRLQESMLTGRLEAFSWSPGKTMANFYRRVGLTQVTNSNKIAAIAAAHSAMKIWGQQILGNKGRGALFDPHGELRELGIPNAEHADFAKWITGLDHIPTFDEMNNTSQGQRWAEAVQRFVQKTVLEPTAAEKPRTANSAMGRFVYGLMSYNFAFQRAVLNPAINRAFTGIGYEQQRLGKIAGTASGSARWLAYAVSAAGSMMALQAPVAMLRQEIFDWERADQWRQDGTYLDNILGLAYSRTGLGGVADPLINAYTHLRYDHDMASLFMGAQLTFWLRGIQDMLGPTTETTNTSWYKRLHGGYQLLGMPVAALATALLPGGKYASYLISALGQYATSMSAADLFARTIAGPKGEKTNLTAQQRAAAEAREQQAGTQPPKKQEAPGGTGALSGAWSFLDDLIPPASRAIARYVRP